VPNLTKHRARQLLSHAECSPMITFFCPNCWKEMEERDEMCPRCGVDIVALVQSRGYVDSLIIALSHSDPATTVRAAWVLGRLRATKAVEPLLRLVESDTGIYRQFEAIEALGRIGDRRARPALTQFAEHAPAPLQDALHAAMARLANDADGRAGKAMYGMRPHIQSMDE
jgi:hypothetical protein